MKNYLRNTHQLMVFAVSGLFIIFSQTLTLAQELNRINGTWLINWQETIDAMTAEERNHFNGLPQEIRQKVENTFSGRKFTFNTNGTVRIEWPAGKTETGEYTATEANLTITLGSLARNYEIRLLADQLTLKMENTGPGPLFSTLILKH